jgi:hypothetical protein
MMERTRRTSWKGSLLKNVASWNATDKYVDFFGDVLKRKDGDLFHQLSPNPDDLADDLDISCSEV